MSRKVGRGERATSAEPSEGGRGERASCGEPSEGGRGERARASELRRSRLREGGATERAALLDDERGATALFVRD